MGSTTAGSRFTGNIARQLVTQQPKPYNSQQSACPSLLKALFSNKTNPEGEKATKKKYNLLRKFSFTRVDSMETSSTFSKTKKRSQTKTTTHAKNAPLIDKFTNYS